MRAFLCAERPSWTELNCFVSRSLLDSVLRRVCLTLALTFVGLILRYRCCLCWVYYPTKVSPTLQTVSICLFEPLSGALPAYVASPRELTFTWWGCCGLCLWHKPTELSHSFFILFLCLFLFLWPFDRILVHKFSQQLSAFVLCSSCHISALLVIWTTIVIYESLPQPWYNPLWLTGLKAPTRYVAMFFLKGSVFSLAQCSVVLGHKHG